MTLPSTLDAATARAYILASDILNGVSAFLSLVVIFIYLLLRHNLPVIANRVTLRLAVAISTADLFYSISNIFVVELYTDQSRVCAGSMFLHLVAGLASMMLATMVAVNLHIVFLLRLQNTLWCEKWYYIVSLAVPLGLAASQVGQGHLGTGGEGCGYMFPSDWTTTRRQLEILLVWYGWVAITVFASIIATYVLWSEMHKQISRRQMPSRRVKLFVQLRRTILRLSCYSLVPFLSQAVAFTAYAIRDAGHVRGMGRMFEASQGLLHAIVFFYDPAMAIVLEDVRQYLIDKYVLELEEKLYGHHVMAAQLEEEYNAHYGALGDADYGNGNDANNGIGSPDVDHQSDADDGLDGGMGRQRGEYAPLGTGGSGINSEGVQVMALGGGPPHQHASAFYSAGYLSDSATGPSFQQQQQVPLMAVLPPPPQRLHDLEEMDESASDGGRASGDYGDDDPTQQQESMVGTNPFASTDQQHQQQQQQHLIQHQQPQPSSPSVQRIAKPDAPSPSRRHSLAIATSLEMHTPQRPSASDSTRLPSPTSAAVDGSESSMHLIGRPSQGKPPAKHVQVIDPSHPRPAGTAPLRAPPLPAAAPAPGVWGDTDTELDVRVDIQEVAVAKTLPPPGRRLSRPQVQPYIPAPPAGTDAAVYMGTAAHMHTGAISTSDAAAAAAADTQHDTQRDTDQMVYTAPPEPPPDDPAANNDAHAHAVADADADADAVRTQHYNNFHDHAARRASIMTMRPRFTRWQWFMYWAVSTFLMDPIDPGVSSCEAGHQTPGDGAPEQTQAEEVDGEKGAGGNGMGRWRCTAEHADSLADWRRRCERRVAVERTTPAACPAAACECRVGG
ncbi:hypothetical protein BC831DRAFT_277563 [Entophlyctis helioformis]|nr:hypothetical protein BC831DRAFT_277563 [Entophlyctis helioformis]